MGLGRLETEARHCDARRNPIIVGASYETRALLQSQFAPGCAQPVRSAARVRVESSPQADRSVRRSEHATVDAAMSDSLHVFLFEHCAVRGAIVQLDAAWRFMRSLRAYPAVVEALLGESIVAAALLASTLKRTHGSLSLQMQGDGPLGLLFAECSSDYGLRATAYWSGPIAPAPLSSLLGSGRCVITLGSGGAPSYQGIVPIESSTLAQALEAYMERSEQLQTQIALDAGSDAAVGLLLQRIPGGTDADPDDWNRIRHLAHTVSARELRELTVPTLLRRLFPQDDVRLFDGRPLAFACSCSEQRVQGMLLGLGRAEAEAVLAERGRMEVACEFCGQVYTFDAERCRALFAAAGQRTER
jgi:molecular chaperone Hsp33